jgi:hypothetical protein
VRLLLRFGIFAALLGLAVGLVLRVSLGRRRFALLAGLALVPLALHATYLLVLAGRAGLSTLPTAAFAGTALVLLLLGVMLGRAWSTSRPWLTVLVPLGVAVLYAIVATLLLTPAWEAHAYAPDAVAGAVYGLASLFAAALLVPFAFGERVSGPPRLPGGPG